MTLYYTKRCFSINSLLLKIKIMLINQKINGELHIKRLNNLKKLSYFCNTISSENPKKKHLLT
jgi:hypothetical protein